MLIKRNLVVLLAMVVIITGSIFINHKTVQTGLRKDPPSVVVSLGEDLNNTQKQQVMDIFGPWQSDKNPRFVSVSNSEERQYLQGWVDDKLIGTKAISSIYCELLDHGKGIEVQIHNITAITPFMYANALTTAGVKDARVIVVAPFKVSGTAALTGIIKAFETASGEKLKENAKQAAHQEIAETSELGQRIGQTNAERMIFDTKKQVIAARTSDPEQIRKIVIKVSADLNVKLSENDINRLVDLMVKMNNLNMDVNNLNQQLKNLDRSLHEISGAGKQTTHYINQLIASIKSWIIKLQQMLTPGLATVNIFRYTKFLGQ